MKPRLWTAVLMFISSYSPLLFILSARDFNFEKYQFNNPIVVGVCVVMAVVSFLLLKLVTRQFKGGIQVTVEKVENRSVELLNYTIPYLISFLPLKIGQPQELLAFGMFMLMMFWLTYKTDNLYINPVLTLIGYRLLRLTFKEQAEGSRELSVNVLAKQDLGGGEIIFVEKITTYLYIQSARKGS